MKNRLTLFTILVLVVSFTIPAFAEEARPQPEGVYYQKQSDGKWHEVWNFPDYRCQPDCKLTIVLDKQPRSELGEKNPHYQLGETVKMKILFFEGGQICPDAQKSLALSIWGNGHVQETIEITPEEPLIYEYVIENNFNVGEYKIFGMVCGFNDELFFTVYDSSPPVEKLEPIVEKTQENPTPIESQVNEKENVGFFESLIRFFQSLFG